ncbi:U3 small nucleolar RNA-associated protein 11 [Polyplosphaeria fusca]|uniref:U3 small nucleolar RNA-associated protein 11 n=1 Tax=Polyplosphaeria fusca TaxID=682080 RepID=A0A9P4QXD7_9PLEO|nr:U3 small nucleolar RNA-associated protein 11 [Polyplosphaeria fusca]
MSYQWRNAVQRRNHKERAQPLERERLGLLEKRQDYKKRAQDHKVKRQKLKILKNKASERNPDEFSFGMMSSRVDSKGRKIADRGNKALSMDVVKLLKTQDAGYIRTMLQMVRKERQELEEKIFLGEKEAQTLARERTKNGKHTVFVGDKEDQKGFKADEWFGTERNMSDRAWNRPRKQATTAKDESEDDEDTQPKKLSKKLSKKQQESQKLAEKEERAVRKKRERAQERLTTHLEAVKARERDLVIADEELEKQRAKMSNTIGGVNKHGVKFKIRERKR